MQPALAAMFAKALMDDRREQAERFRRANSPRESSDCEEAYESVTVRRSYPDDGPSLRRLAERDGPGGAVRAGGARARGGPRRARADLVGEPLVDARLLGRGAEAVHVVHDRDAGTVNDGVPVLDHPLRELVDDQDLLREVSRAHDLGEVGRNLVDGRRVGRADLLAGDVAHRKA